MDLFLLMLIILNPFSQVLFLRELFNALSFQTFIGVHLRASLYSFTIFAVFVLFGDPILQEIFQVRLGSLRVFGGLVNVFVAYRYMTVGEGSVLLFKGNVAELVPNITLPYMVGPGMLWVSIMMGRVHPVPIALAMIVGVLTINMVFVLMAYGVFRHAGTEQENGFAKHFAVMMRMMALFVGAVGVEMFVGGLQELL